MYLLIVISVAVFAFCYETAIVPVRKDGCVGLLRCNASVTVFKGNNIADVIGLANEDQYNQVCESYDRFQLCVAMRQDACQDPTTLKTFLSQTEIMNFLCSSERRRTLEETPCMADQVSQLAAQEGVDVCMNDFQLEVQADLFESLVNGSDPDSNKICPSVDQLKGCVNNTLITECGRDFAVFYMLLWKMNFRHIAEKLGCWTDRYPQGPDIPTGGNLGDMTTLS